MWSFRSPDTASSPTSSRSTRRPVRKRSRPSCSKPNSGRRSMSTTSRLDYHIIKTDDDINKMDVLLVAARKEYLRMYLGLIEDCGLRPVVVDDDAFAILNAYEAQLRNRSDPGHGAGEHRTRCHQHHLSVRRICSSHPRRLGRDARNFRRHSERIPAESGTDRQSA